MRAAAAGAMIVASLYSGPVTAGPIQATGPWHVDYDDTQCVASRDYGKETKPITLTLIPSATGAAMRILFVRNGRVDQTQEPAKLELGKEKPIDTYSFIYDVQEKNHKVILLNVPMGQFRAAAPAEMIGIESDSLTAEFAANLLPNVLTALDTCLVDLQKAWNITIPLPTPGPENPPRPGTRTVFSTADYPPAAQNRGLSGDVGVSILIDEAGKVADCTVDHPSGVGILDAATCFTIEQRAKFVPARDAQGKPIRSAVAQTVRWQLTP